MNKALIVGFGPSIQQNMKDWERLGEFPGLVFVCDSAIETVLNSTIMHPFYGTTLEDGEDLNKYFIPPNVKKLGSQIITVLTSDRTHKKTLLSIKDAGLKYETAAKARDWMNTSNVALYSYHIARVVYNCNEIYLLGMDHCYAKDKPPPVDQNSELFAVGFYKLWEPHNDEHLILNPAHELWREEFDHYTKTFPEIKVTNLTGRGALYNREKYIWKPIKEMQQW